jgi:hypothetical protein
VFKEEFLNHISDLTASVDKAENLAELDQIRYRAVLLFERSLGPKHSMTLRMEEFDPRDFIRPTIMRSLFDRRPRHSAAAHKLRMFLDDARFLVSMDGIPVLDATGARGFQPEVAGHLAHQVEALIQDVESALIPESDRAEVLSALNLALATLRRSDSPAAIRATLDQILGRAVTKTAEKGAAASWWKKIAETVILAEAAVSLGIGLGAFDAPDPVSIEVECNVVVPELNPGDPPVLELPQSTGEQPPDKDKQSPADQPSNKVARRKESPKATPS